MFAAAEPVSGDTLCAVTGATPDAVWSALAQLRQDYEGRGIVLRAIAGGWLMSSNAECRADVERFLLPPKTHMSAAALETLSIIAYLQPVTRAEIESLRGVNADAVMNTLEQRELIRELGRKDVVGRPILYGTTDLFLQSFGLQSLGALPPLPEGAPQRIDGELVAAPVNEA